MAKQRSGVVEQGRALGDRLTVEAMLPSVTEIESDARNRQIDADTSVTEKELRCPALAGSQFRVRYAPPDRS
jgi:hypothetical protein